jgi:hypothetical protein
MADPKETAEQEAREEAEKLQSPRKPASGIPTPEELEQGQRDRQAIQAVAQAVIRSLDDVSAPVRQILGSLNRLNTTDPANEGFKTKIKEDLKEKISSIAPELYPPKKAGT